MRCVGLLKVLETIRSALPCFRSEWAKLNDEFGADTVRYYFEPIDLESNDI